MRRNYKDVCQWNLIEFLFRSGLKDQHGDDESYTIVEITLYFTSNGSHFSSET